MLANILDHPVTPSLMKTARTRIVFRRASSAAAAAEFVHLAMDEDNNDENAPLFPTANFVPRRTTVFSVFSSFPAAAPMISLFAARIYEYYYLAAASEEAFHAVFSFVFSLCNACKCAMKFYLQQQTQIESEAFVWFSLFVPGPH